MNNSPIVRAWAAVICGSVLVTPLAAQDEDGVTSDPEGEAQVETAAPSAPPRPFGGGLDLSVTVPRDPDAVIEEQCERENEVGRIQGEIVVCRQLGEASDGSYDREEFERSYAERTQGEKPVNVSGMRELANSISIGSAPEPVLMIDVESLPQAPEGSDADRIARGLPALGQDEELTPEEIQRRRRAAGLDAPDLPGQ